MMAEINELRRQIEEKEAINAQMDQNKKLTNQNIEELKRHLDDETRSKQALSEQFQIQREKNDMLRTQVEENQNSKKELQRKLTKTNKEVVVWKSKYETDAVQDWGSTHQRRSVQAVLGASRSRAWTLGSAWIPDSENRRIGIFKK